ncbi:MAG: hypothetical protein K2N06_07225 [Oscillospiraceae bacterium]|nr:hypothetical protein [Oscillospiraceae bacterium]
MKKIIALAAALVVTLSLVGCNDNNESPTGGSSTTTSEATNNFSNEESTTESTSSTEESTTSTEESTQPPESGEDFVIELPESLQSLEKTSVDNLQYTVWWLIGGMVDGVELNDTDMDDLNEMFGGTFTLLFQEDTNVNISAGENFAEAVYVLSDNNSSISIENENAMAKGVFVSIDGVPTLLMVQKDSPNVILYMQQIDER